MVRTVQDQVTYQHQDLVTRLQEARTQPHVRLAFKDGRQAAGAITFIERLGTGRLINVDDEYALDFTVQELQEVDY